MTVLIVEDDRDIAELVAYNLAQEHFSVKICESGSKGLAEAERFLPELIILDLMLPDTGGLEVCKALRATATTRDIPILILTARGTEVDRVVGFEVGADDYLTKPFSPRELVLRVKSILRRREKGNETGPDVLCVHDIRIDPVCFSVSVGGEAIKLTAIEFKLLHYLASTRGRVASRDALLDHVWGFDSALTTRTVDTHVKRLRQKLKDAGHVIETIHGVGYRFKE